jgi:6-phosphogluconolactonase
MGNEIKIFPTQESLAESLADDICELIYKLSGNSSSFTIALSGGKTPDLLFSVLGKKYNQSEIWRYVSFFWVDERCVPPDDEESNFKKAHDLFFSRTNINQGRIFRIRGENDPVSEAERYSGVISENTTHKRGLPSFSLILLGLGEDGHTASIFPGNEILFKSARVCETAMHPVTGQKRVTLTGPVLNNADCIIFLAAGQNKSQIVKKILKGDESEKSFPASFIKPVDGSLIWYLDTGAASLLSPSGRLTH